MDNAVAGCVPRRLRPDRRKTERKRQFAAGILTYGGGAFILNCLVRDISGAGAQIRASSDQLIPKETHVIHLDNHYAYQARTIWRSGSLMGLCFAKEYLIEDVLPADLEFLRNVFIAGKLRQVDQMTARGTGTTEALLKLNMSHVTYVHWRHVSGT